MKRIRPTEAPKFSFLRIVESSDLSHRVGDLLVKGDIYFINITRKLSNNSLHTNIFVREVENLYKELK